MNLSKFDSGVQIFFLMNEYFMGVRAVHVWADAELLAVFVFLECVAGWWYNIHLTKVKMSAEITMEKSCSTASERWNCARGCICTLLISRWELHQNWAPDLPDISMWQKKKKRKAVIMSGNKVCSYLERLSYSCRWWCVSRFYFYQCHIIP